MNVGHFQTLNVVHSQAPNVGHTMVPRLRDELFHDSDKLNAETKSSWQIFSGKELKLGRKEMEAHNSKAPSTTTPFSKTRHAQSF